MDDLVHALWPWVAALLTLAVTLYLRHRFLKPFQSAVAVEFSIFDARRCLLPQDEKPAKLRRCTPDRCACWNPDENKCTADKLGGPIVTVRTDDEA